MSCDDLGWELPVQGQDDHITVYLTSSYQQLSLKLERFLH